MFRFLIVLATGYVLGTKAGRGRYEQIVKGYQALTGSPATQKMIAAGRRRLADKLSPEPRMVELTTIEETTILEPASQLDKKS